MAAMEEDKRKRKDRYIFTNSVAYTKMMVMTYQERDI